MTFLKHAFVAVAVFQSLAFGAADLPAGTLTVELTDNRRVVDQIISKDLLLQLLNVSTGEEHYGWEVRVLRQPVSLDSPNLIHYSAHGPDPMDVQAWHVAEKFYPNERTITVKGYPYQVTIRIVDPQTAGAGSDARFTSGSIKVSWKKTQ